MNSSEFRLQYSRQGLRRKDLNSDPFLQFELWLEQAVTAGVVEPDSNGAGHGGFRWST